MCVRDSCCMCVCVKYKERERENVSMCVPNAFMAHIYHTSSKRAV